MLLVMCCSGEHAFVQMAVKAVSATTIMEDAIPIVSGAVAGLSVDVILFPLDTVKTRLQSQSGFWANGGFRNVYRGMGSVVVGSMPSAGVFFITYEKLKQH